MAYLARRDWLGELTDAQLVAQAEVRAAATRTSVEKILSAWVVNGYLDLDRKRSIVASL